MTNEIAVVATLAETAKDPLMHLPATISEL